MKSPATSKFIDESNYYASAEILGNLNFIEKEMSNIKCQFDETDLITYFTGIAVCLQKVDRISKGTGQGNTRENTQVFSSPVPFEIRSAFCKHISRNRYLKNCTTI